MVEIVGLTYLAIVNLIAFICYGVDKKKAIRHEWRIPEATLITLAVIGGALGALLGMMAFHHKTRKAKFTVTVPLCLLLWILLVAVYFFWIAREI